MIETRYCSFNPYRLWVEDERRWYKERYPDRSEDDRYLIFEAEVQDKNAPRPHYRYYNMWLKDWRLIILSPFVTENFKEFNLLMQAMTNLSDTEKYETVSGEDLKRAWNLIKRVSMVLNHEVMPKLELQMKFKDSVANAKHLNI